MCRKSSINSERCRLYLVLCVVFLSCLYAGSVHAARTYNLSELINLSKTYLPRLKSRSAMIEVSESKVTIAKHSRAPDVEYIQENMVATANQALGSFIGQGVVPTAGINFGNKQEWTGLGGSYYSLIAKYEVVNFGLTRAKIAEAEAEAALSRAHYEQDFYLLKKGITQLYFSILQLKSYERVSKENVSRYEDIVSVIRSLTNSGIKPGSDLSLAEAELAKARVLYNNYGAAVVRSLQLLETYTGISYKELEIVEPVLSLDVVEMDETLLSTSSITGNPILKFRKEQLMETKAAKRLAKKEFLPKIMLLGAVWGRGSSAYPSQHPSIAGFGLKPIPSGWNIQRGNYFIGGMLTYNFMNLLHRRDKVRSVEKLLLAQTESYNQEVLQQRMEMEQANTSILNTRRNLESLTIQEREAKKVYEDKRSQYKAGLVTLIDLANATFVLFRSVNDYIEALYTLYLARLDKAAAIGRLDDFIQSVK